MHFQRFKDGQRQGPASHGKGIAQESRARLFRRPRHLDHPEVAANHLWLRGRDLHRRSRPRRGAGARAQEGAAARDQAGEHLRRGPARGIRARLRVPDVPRQRGLRGAISARHLNRAAADCQEADRNRRESRRRRGGPWRHRQGQRPGALRACLLRAQAGRDGDRAVARMGPDVAYQADRVRREAPNSDRQGQARRCAVLRGCQSVARVVGRQSAGGSRSGSTGLRLFAHCGSGKGAGQADLHQRGFRTRRCDGDRRQEIVAGGAAHQAQRIRQGQWHRPARSGREPLRRHEIARHVRDAGRHHSARRPSRHRVRSRSTAAPRISKTS